MLRKVGLVVAIAATVMFSPAAIAGKGHAAMVTVMDTDMDTVTDMAMDTMDMVTITTTVMGTGTGTTITTDMVAGGAVVGMGME